MKNYPRRGRSQTYPYRDQKINMKYDLTKHHRRSIRLKGYDYTQPGAYFITICTYQRQVLFGEIVDGVMVLNAYGEIVQHAWDDLPNHYPHVVLDELCIMPNHIHGIIILTGWGGSQTHPNDDDDENLNNVQHGLPEIVRALKSFSSRRINQIIDSPGVPLWQRNYFERIVRNEEELNSIRRYVQENPLKWKMDQDNPANINNHKVKTR